MSNNPRHEEQFSTDGGEKNAGRNPKSPASADYLQRDSPNAITARLLPLSARLLANSTRRRLKSPVASDPSGSGLLSAGSVISEAGDHGVSQLVRSLPMSCQISRWSME
jgi:hypothetical protein